MAAWDGGEFLRGRVRGDARTARRGSAAQVPFPAVRVFFLFLFSSLWSISCFLKKERGEKPNSGRRAALRSGTAAVRVLAAGEERVGAAHPSFATIRGEQLSPIYITVF